MGRDALRKCVDCGCEAHTEEELELFEKEADGKHGRRNLCSTCRKERDRKWRAENKDKVRLKSKKHHATQVYGVSLEEYEVRMSSSKECQICGSEDNLCYDHDHDTMAFRGVLCSKCNRSLGHFGDNLEGLMHAVKYLENHYGKCD